MIPGTITWEDPLTTVPAAGQATYRWTFTPDDTMHYLSASNTIHFSVDKATPTGAPTYTAITAGGKTLADAALTANASWPSGTVQWVDKDGKVLDTATTDVKANTAYQWKFTPDSKNYDPIEGSITLYYVSTGGGGSTTYPVSTPSKTENGSVSVSPKNASRGDTVTITVKPDDGYVLDDLAVTDKNGNDLKAHRQGQRQVHLHHACGQGRGQGQLCRGGRDQPVRRCGDRRLLLRSREVGRGAGHHRRHWQ